MKKYSLNPFELGKFKYVNYVIYTDTENTEWLKGFEKVITCPFSKWWSFEGCCFSHIILKKIH